METVVLAVIGVAAVYYVVRLLWKEAKGQAPCACGGCDKKGSCGDKKDKCF